MSTLGRIALVLLFATVTFAAVPAEMDGKYLVLTRQDLGIIDLKTPRPTYPIAYRRDGREAAFRLRIYVGADGKIEGTKVLKRVGDPVLVDYVVNWAKKNFTSAPPMRNGKPTPVCFDMPFVFYISDRRGIVSRFYVPGTDPNPFIDRYGR